MRRHRGAIYWIAKALMQSRTLIPMEVDAVVKLARLMEDEEYQT